MRKYANENSSKEMLHYLGRLCDELYWQQHTIYTIYNVALHLLFFIFTTTDLYKLSENTIFVT